MSEYVLEECFSLREAVESLKSRIKKLDEANLKSREFWAEHNPSRLKESMEEENWSDKFHLVYRNDGYEDEFYIFVGEYNIENWLGEMWSKWDLWDYSNIQSFLDEHLIVWEFHRNICIEKWDLVYGESKTFIDGWSRKREYIQYEVVPSFSIR